MFRLPPSPGFKQIVPHPDSTTFSQEENHERAEVERRKQEQRLRERNRRQREIAEERRLRELKKKVSGLTVPPVVKVNIVQGDIDPHVMLDDFVCGWTQVQVSNPVD